MARRFRNLVELGEESCRTFAERPLFGTKTPLFEKGTRGGYAWVSYAQFQRLVDALE